MRSTQNTICTLSDVKNALSNEKVYQQIVKNTLQIQGDNISASLKLRLLTDLISSSDELESFYIGNRHLLPVEAGLYGLEVALSNRNQVDNDTFQRLSFVIAERLPDNYEVQIAGTTLSTEVLQHWGQGINLPELTQHNYYQHENVVGVRNAMHQHATNGTRFERNHNTHNDEVVRQSLNRLNTMIDRIGGVDKVLSIDATSQGLSHAINRIDPNF